MEIDIEAKTGSEWPEVLRSLEVTLRRLTDRVLELNEQTHETDPGRSADELPEDELERIDRIEAGRR